MWVGKMKITSWFISASLAQHSISSFLPSFFPFPISSYQGHPRLHGGQMFLLQLGAACAVSRKVLNHLNI